MHPAAGILALLVALRAQDPDPTVARWQAHYAAVERELRAAEPSDSTADQEERRGVLLNALAAYRERAEFARHADAGAGLTPRFVDDAGRRCAVAELLHASGEDAIVERVRRLHNDAWIADLAGDAELRAWLAASGLSLEEAARIQTPSGYRGPGETVYHPPPPPGEPDGETRPVPSGRNPGEPGASGAAGLPRAGGSSTAHVEEEWWIWWELNKLEYLAPRGLEERLLARGLTAADVARMTEPLRHVRLPLLLPALSDPDALVRASAALALGRIGGAAAVEPLTVLLADPSQRVREHALLGLGAGGTSAGGRILLGILERGGRPRADAEPITPRALPLTILALAVGRRAGMDPAVAGTVALWAPRAEGGDRVPALWAACLFQRIAPDPALEALVLELAGDRDQPLVVRGAALEALAASTDPAAIARLQDALFGRDLDLRRSAALALGKSPQALATAALLTACELEAEPLARGFALLSLGMRGGAPARDLLLEMLERGPRASEAWAALALGLHARSTPDPRISAALLAAAPRVENEDARPAVLLALGLARERGAEALARERLATSASPRERAYSATTLALLGGAANHAVLRERLALEGSDFVRAAIAQGLASLGAPEDAPALFHALAALSDRSLQAVTAATLGQLGAANALAGLEELARSGPGSALVRATALDGLGVLLERGEPLVLPDATRAANFALYEDWAFELFLIAL